ncbi:MAG: hypothetical protein HYU78_03060 [Rhodocyclales bacterium]|nr:hypothetical protein [Rhodocyclales bacterium]
MRIWLAAASFALWGVSAQQDGLERAEAGFWYAALGWLQPGIVALGSADGSAADGAYQLTARSEATSHVAR